MVYFISDGTYTKIGKSNNPVKRIKSLQTSNANELKFIYIFDCKKSVRLLPNAFLCDCRS